MSAPSLDQGHPWQPLLTSDTLCTILGMALTHGVYLHQWQKLLESRDLGTISPTSVIPGFLNVFSKHLLRACCVPRTHMRDHECVFQDWEGKEEGG